MTQPAPTAQPTPAVRPLAAWEVRRRFLLFLVPGILQVGLSFVTLPLTTLVLGPTPGSYSGTMQVNQAGPWELAISDGQRARAMPAPKAARTAWRRSAGRTSP